MKLYLQYAAGLYLSMLANSALAGDEGDEPRSELLPKTYQSSQNRLGFESAYDNKKKDLSLGLFAFEHASQWAFSEDSSAVKLILRCRLLIDANFLRSLHDPELRQFEKLIAYVEKPWNNFKFSLGWQELSWGENLILPILDVVNPRNLTALRGFYDPTAKQASPMLLMERRDASWEMQMIVVPLPIKSNQPKEIADFGIKDERQYRLLEDSEYGGRLSWLNEGLDTRFYYFKHQPREPSYKLNAFSGVEELDIVEEMVETTGLSMSYAGYSWLFRGDLASHKNFPATSIASQVERTRLDQTILGLSWSAETQQTIGIEWYNDLWQKLPDAFTEGPWVEKKKTQRYMNWLGLNANLSSAGSMWEPQIFYLKGVNNNDQMIKFSLQANINDHVTVTSEFQKTETETSSPKLLLSRTEVWMLRTYYSF